MTSRDSIQQTKEQGDRRRFPRRHVVVGLCALSLFICYIDRVNISVAIIPMAEEFGWDDSEKGLVLASFFVGYLATQVMGGWLSNRFGSKPVLGFAVLWWSLFTILTPLAAALSLPVLLATRAIMGLGEGLAYPAAFTLLSRWVPERERTRSATVSHSAGSLGVIVAILTAPWIAVEFGWATVFYLFGAAGIVWFFFWQKYVSSTPRDCHDISDEELRLIEATAGKEQSVAVPWRKLARLPAVWAVVINHFCFAWGLYVMLSWLPSYFSGQFGVSLGSVWIYTVPPWIVLFATTIGAGQLADRAIAKGVSTTVVRKIAQSFGLLGPAAALYFLGKVTDVNVAALLLCLAMGMTGCALAGFGTNLLDIAPRYAGIVWGVSNTVATIPGIVGVAVTGWLVGSTGSYDSAFILTAMLYLFAVVIWWLFASGKRLVD